ncbi:MULTISPECIES: hypothetical protein [unclassified Pseudomonas]|uniref:hypothetical protein n=1 Tax=unclassified Pseudomonas TaxID=196821 RepID=UPI00235E0530|nr:MULTISPECIES: hypothetical protein [unclassified Pseudomonas]
MALSMVFPQAEDEQNFHRNSEVYLSAKEFERIINTRIFERENRSSPLFKSAFTGAVINLRDLLMQCKAIGDPVDWTDDVEQLGKIKDVSDLISVARNAMCHLDSPLHRIQNSYISFNIAYGKSVVYRSNELIQQSIFEDDIAFCIGIYTLYLNRHMLKAFVSAIEILNRHGIIDSSDWQPPAPFHIPAFDAVPPAKPSP